MKRLVVLFALPALLLVIWWGGRQSRDQSAAEIDIATERVTATRGAVINTVSALGGKKVVEDSHFGDDGSSELVFRLPTRQLERAIAELDGIGGRVTDQSVDLSDTVAQAQGVDDAISGARGCLGEVAKLGAGDGLSEVKDKVDTCDRALEGAGDAAATATNDLAIARLTVRVHPERSVNPFLVIAALVILVATLVMGAIVVRSTRQGRDDFVIDDDTGVIHLEDDLFLRRN